MPYQSVDDLPAQFNKYSAKGKRAALQAFNNVYSKAGESKAFATAHVAAKKADAKPAKRAKGRVTPTTRFNDAASNNGAT